MLPLPFALPATRRPGGPACAPLASSLTGTNKFISDENGTTNFSDPIDSVFKCIALLGQDGCGFEHQLGSIDRALGADGLVPIPSTNQNFLRDDAYLGIVIGHLCQDPNGAQPTALVEPPITPPTDATTFGSNPMLPLADCESNENGPEPPFSWRRADVKS